ncbi:hypothetical protein, partial [Citrobacter sp. wls831]|uniref:hypothetical protein n=1 Tax=Citrobacter sp. wls831 TaxID=2576410 RepID=UPI001BAFC3D1
GAFQWWGGLDGWVGTDLWLHILDVVTIISGFCPPRRGGSYFWFFRTGADVSPLQGRSFFKSVHRAGDEQVMYL